MNKIRKAFPRCSLAVSRQLFRSFCCSYYGSSLWDLSRIESLSVRWRQSLRVLLGLPKRTHRWLFPLILRAPSPEEELLWRFAKFWTSCHQSPNPVLRLCADLTIGSSTNAAGNLRLVLMELNQGVPDTGMCSRLKGSWHKSLNEQVSVQASLAIELIDMINGNYATILNVNECLIMLNYVVT